MQWFHIGSYRLATRLFSAGGVHPKGWAAFGQLLSVMSDCFCVCRRDIKLAQN
jgi:hypothetical protein